MSTVCEKINHIKYSNKKYNYIYYELESECPICKSKISPDPIEIMAYANNSKDYVCILNYCPGCSSPFISIYSTLRNESSIYCNSILLSCEPNRYSKHVFESNIVNLSPQFDEIYNQALAAESSGLDEIAGLGYRKSLEFLVKDFAIHEHPEEEETIKTLMLSPCIKKYIDNPQIKTLVERSTWIGNDEAHYIRKQNDRDVNDMKSFIKATVYFIGMVLITEDAASMEPAQ